MRNLINAAKTFKSLLDDLQKKKKQLTWYGLIKRTSDEIIPKIAFNYKTNQK